MILAVDLGSTNLKAAIFSFDGRKLGEGSQPLPYTVRAHDRSELHPDEVLHTFVRSASLAAQSAGIALVDVNRASIASQAQTFCICDAHGTARSPFVGWTDIRAQEEAAALERTLGDCFHSITGLPNVMAGLLLPKLVWWQNYDGLGPEDRIMLLPSYLALKLGAPHVVDCNLAAMTGCFSIPENTWWPNALDACGLTVGQLGQVVPTGEAVEVKRFPPNPLLPGLRSVVIAGNDHTAGAVGCGCSASRSVLTLGTAGVFYRFAGTVPGPYSPDGIWGPYPGGGFYELRFISHACSALDWADEYLFGKVDSPRFVEIATLAPAGSRGVRFDSEKWGRAEAWSSVGTPEVMARAVLEGIAEKIEQLVAPALQASPNDKPEIVLLGGGSRLLPWVQMLEQRLRTSLHPSTADGLLGAARLGGVA